MQLNYQNPHNLKFYENHKTEIKTLWRSTGIYQYQKTSKTGNDTTKITNNHIKPNSIKQSLHISNSTGWGKDNTFYTCRVRNYMYWEKYGWENPEFNNIRIIVQRFVKNTLRTFYLSTHMEKYRKLCLTWNYVGYSSDHLVDSVLCVYIVILSDLLCTQTIRTFEKCPEDRSATDTVLTFTSDFFSLHPTILCVRVCENHL